MPNPDFIITINGQDVTKYARELQFVDDEEGQSEIEVILANPDMKLSGKFDYEDDLQIRFGYQGELSGIAYLPVAEVKERYPTGSEPIITIIGRDESSKMSGGKEKGSLGKDKDDAEIMKKIGEEAGMQIATEGEGTKHKHAARHNENPQELAARFGRNMKPKQSGGGGSSGPSSPFQGEKKGLTFSSAERIPEDGKDRDSNRGQNHSNQHGNEPVTGSLELKGYPTLKAKKCVTILGVGSKASGTYYVKKATHRWSVGGTFTTRADLIRGGSGKGSAGGSPPMVMYADIWNQGQAYLGPRKMDGESQATFTYGDGKHMIDFEYHLHPQKDRHGGEGAEGEGHDFRDLGKAYKAAGEEAGEAAAGGS